MAEVLIESAKRVGRCDSTGRAWQFTYEDVAPLDWPQLRVLLWEALEIFDENEAERWQQVSSFVNAKCLNSTPQSPKAYQAAFNNIASAIPAIRKCSSSPGIGLKIWTEIIYKGAQATFNMTPVFMNLGYLDLGAAKPLYLEAADEPYRPFIQLYENVLGGIELEGRDVLEVGCGSGGGASYMMRYHSPATVVGVDLVEDNIEACVKLHAAAGLSFVQGDAESLQFPDASFDVVVNIESSHSYPAMQSFLDEVYRLLRPNGYFLFADLRPVNEVWGTGRTVEGLRRQLRRSGLRIQAEKNISAHVLASIELLDDVKRALLVECGVVDHDLHHLSEILLCKGSNNYRQCKEGALQYWTFTCRK
jgi:SAM-dependent methyltransferase